MKHRITEISAFTVIQPYAEVILRHGKNVENRQKNSRVRGYVAIHASKTNSRSWFEGCAEDYGLTFDRSNVAFEAIVGFAKLVDVITKKEVTAKTRKWFQGRFGLVLEDPIVLKKPIPTMGARGSWTLRGAPLKKALGQLSKSELLRIQKRNLDVF